MACRGRAAVGRDGMGLVLASGSPRRQQLLEKAGFDFIAVAPAIEETASIELGPQKMCEENARQKAAFVAAHRPGSVVLGSDTLVFLEGKPMGKPHTEERAVEMLNTLSGQRCTVCTGVAIVHGQQVEQFCESVDVVFKTFGQETIRDYMCKVDVLDKAGAFAAQDHAELIIDQIEGDIATVMGLPLERVTRALAGLGLRPGKSDS